MGVTIETFKQVYTMFAINTINIVLEYCYNELICRFWLSRNKVYKEKILMFERCSNQS